MAWELLVFLLALGAVSVGCLLPAAWLPPLPNDKLLHFLAFGGLTLLAWRVASGWGELLYWLAGLVIGGWLIELLQKLVPGRNFSWRDLGANVAGIAVAAVVILLIQAI
ncbi:VanZ family protein [Pseudoduganella sp. UC29_106]|uniref:VanZ family protein n=1 Tax=Pseudoduganella sp. UC29_106 TaxID=3374553 RepID=UPI0037574D87